jgi:hypothetical protein
MLCEDIIKDECVVFAGDSNWCYPVNKGETLDSMIAKLFKQLFPECPSTTTTTSTTTSTSTTTTRAPSSTSTTTSTTTLQPCSCDTYFIKNTTSGTLRYSYRDCSNVYHSLVSLAPGANVNVCTCNNELDVEAGLNPVYLGATCIPATTTSTTSTTTTSTTSTTSTTTTTTTLAPCVCYQLTWSGQVQGLADYVTYLNCNRQLQTYNMQPSNNNICAIQGSITFYFFGGNGVATIVASSNCVGACNPTTTTTSTTSTTTTSTTTTTTLPPCECREGVILNNASYSYYRCNTRTIASGVNGYGVHICYDAAFPISSNIQDVGPASGLTTQCACNGITTSTTTSTTTTTTLGPCKCYSLVAGVFDGTTTVSYLNCSGVISYSFLTSGQSVYVCAIENSINIYEPLKVTSTNVGTAYCGGCPPTTTTSTTTTTISCNDSVGFNVSVAGDVRYTTCCGTVVTTNVSGPSAFILSCVQIGSLASYAGNGTPATISGVTYSGVYCNCVTTTTSTTSTTTSTTTTTTTPIDATVTNLLGGMHNEVGEYFVDANIVLDDSVSVSTTFTIAVTTAYIGVVTVSIVLAPGDSFGSGSTSVGMSTPGSISSQCIFYCTNANVDTTGYNC